MTGNLWDIYRKPVGSGNEGKATILPPSVQIRTKQIVPARGHILDHKPLAECFAGETNLSSLASMNV